MSISFLCICSCASDGLITSTKIVGFEKRQTTEEYYVCILMYVYMYTHVCVLMYVFMYIMYVCILVYVYLYMYTYLLCVYYIFMYVYYVLMCMCIHVLCMLL